MMMQHQMPVMAKPASRRRSPLTPYLLLGPSLVFFAVFFATPLIDALVQAFSVYGEWSFDNFKTMSTDINFYDAVRYTFLLVIIVVPLQLALALAMALLLQKARSRDMVLFIWTIPLGISDLAAGLVWLSILTQSGYLNTLLLQLGFISAPTNWLTIQTPLTMFVAIVIAEVWRATALAFVILLAGLQLIPKEYFEAGEIFGAGPWRKFCRITLPLLKPSLQVAMVLRVIFAFEIFSMVFVLAGRDMPVLAGEAFNWQMAYENAGVACAYAMLILLLSIVATIILFRLVRVNEEISL